MPTTYDILATTTLSGSVNTFTFSGISNAYTDLRLVCNLELNGQGNLLMRCNGNTGTNYVWQNVHAEINGAYSSATIVETAQNFTWYAFQQGGTPNLLTVDFLSYTNAINKSYLWERGIHFGSITNGINQKAMGCGVFTSGSAISSLTISTSSTFTNGGTATLFGILKA